MNHYFCVTCMIRSHIVLFHQFRVCLNYPSRIFHLKNIALTYISRQSKTLYTDKFRGQRIPECLSV